MPPRSPRGLKVPPPGSGLGGPPPPPPPTSTTTAADNLGATLARLGRSICLSVEILATVGETIADENPEIRSDMLEACRDSRAASGEISAFSERYPLFHALTNDTILKDDQGYSWLLKDFASCSGILNRLHQLKKVLLCLLWSSFPPFPYKANLLDKEIR